MSASEARQRPGESRGLFGRLARGTLRVLWPTERLLWTREGVIYLGIWLVMLVLGLNQQINLILLVAGLAAGPVAASFVVSASMLRKLGVSRRAAPYVFSGEPLRLDYTLENYRRWAAALALTVEDELVPVDRAVSGSAGLSARAFFNRVPGREKARVRWQGASPKRGRYRFRTMEVVTRSPFGLLERRVTVSEPGELLVYPTVGRLTRRWHLVHRQATETRRGKSHERSNQQQEYHGLRDYRPGDSPRWIHWRTTARVGVPMVKEFEQQSEQDLALLLDPWLPRTKVTAEQREALEQAVQFAATVCLETCRRSGRRILVGWTGPTPGLRQGPASVKLLHELLEQLAVLHASAEGTLSALFDILPPSTLREASLVVVSTRPVNLVEEAERSSRLSGVASRGLLGRVMLLDASRGDLAEYVKYDGSSSVTALDRRDPEPFDPGRMTMSAAPEPAEVAVPAAGRNGREARAVSFANLYRLSFYAMLFCATLVLSVDVADIPYAPLYPVAVAAAGAVAFLTVDRDRALAVGDVALNLLAIGSLPLAGLEYLVMGPTSLLHALGHWLIYLQLILMFRPKSVVEDWELFVLGLVQVMVGTVVSQSDSVGFMLFGWAVLALWVLGLFSLERDAFRALGVKRTPTGGGPAAVELYPGLLNVPFLVSALRVTVTTMALGGVIFLAMPRRASLARERGFDPSAQHLTGFDDEVQLGQLGEILENDSVVMSIELVTEDGDRVAPDGEPLWRGVTMAKYERGRWFRQGRRPSGFPGWAPDLVIDPATRQPRKTVRQLIKLEPNDSNALFGLRPMLNARAPRRAAPDLNGIDGTISRSESRPGLSYDYEVKSALAQDLPQPGERRPDFFVKRDQLLAVPAPMRAQLRAIAERVIETNPDRRGDTRARARALEEYLRDSGLFKYTLKLEVSDPSLDPVVDFLVNRKSGHCEYFASALALLLRSVDIPTRLVNGFKGGDWNDLARVLYVRQKHAHSWVEAYLGEDAAPEHRPVWMTLDPTPMLARDESVARVGGFRGKFRQVTDLFRYVWVFYVVGYNSDRQDRLLYQPIRELIREARDGFAIMGENLQKVYDRVLELLHFETPRSFISPRGFVVSFVALFVLVMAFRGIVWLVRRLLRWYRGNGEESAAHSVGAAQYRRLALLLAGCGLERPPAETQDEFARRATGFLTARGSNTEAVADVPRLVVDAFYRVRFGRLDLSPTALLNLEARLDALEANLKASQE